MIVKIAVVGIVLCLIILLLKRNFKELIIPLEIVFCATVIIIIADEFSNRIELFSDYFDSFAGAGEIFAVIVKAAAICILCKFSSDICYENGNPLIADVIELSGKVMLMVISYPFIEGLINIALAFAE